ncbi:3039_t:CDS:2 [Entrophospora sp. SA101]|nr:3039_t:CDS:2 [Entrophospora sp. SA101]
MKPVSTIKQAREEIAKLLEETENGNLDCFQSFQNSLIKIIKTYYFGLTCKLTGEGNLLLAEVVDGYPTQTGE